MNLLVKKPNCFRLPLFPMFLNCFVKHVDAAEKKDTVI